MFPLGGEIMVKEIIKQMILDSGMGIFD